MKKQIRVVICLITSFIFLISPVMGILAIVPDETSENSVEDTRSASFPFPKSTVIIRDFKPDYILFQGKEDSVKSGLVNKILDENTKKPSFTDEGYYYLVDHADISKVCEKLGISGLPTITDPTAALNDAKAWYEEIKDKSYDDVQKALVDIWNNGENNFLYHYVVYHANQFFNTVDGLNLQINNNDLNLDSFADEFFPIDEKGFGNGFDNNYVGNDHNYHFTLEAHTKFNFDGKPHYFEFTGDDDVWVYIDDQLVIDLGGIHWKAEQKIRITRTGEVELLTNPYWPEGGTWTPIENLKLEKGKSYDFDFYFMERRHPNSVFKIGTDIEFSDPEDMTPIEPEPQMVSLTLEKEVVDSGGNVSSPINEDDLFTVQLQVGDNSMVNIRLKANDEVTLSSLQPGDYVIKEIIPMNYDLDRIMIQTDGGEPALVIDGQVSLEANKTYKVVIINQKTNNKWFYVKDQLLNFVAEVLSSKEDK